MQIRWRPTAEADFDEIIDYVARDDAVASLALGDTILEHVAGIIDNPRLYRAGRMRGTREMVVHPNYVVVYRIARGTVEILRVLHTARKWPPSR